MVKVLHTKPFLVVEVPGQIGSIECCNLIHWVFQHCSLKFVLWRSWRHPFRDRLFSTSLISIIMTWCISSNFYTRHWVARAYPSAGGLGLKPTFELDVFQKCYYLCKREMFSHTFYLLICWLNTSTMEWICMQISKNIVNVPKSNN